MIRLKICMFAQLSQCRETHGWPVPSGSELSIANCWSKLRSLQSVQVFFPHPGHFCGTPRFASAAQTTSFCSGESGTQSRYQIRAAAEGSSRASRLHCLDRFGASITRICQFSWGCH